MTRRALAPRGSPSPRRADDVKTMKTERSYARADTLLNEVLGIAERIMEERPEPGDDEELAAAIVELDDLLRSSRAVLPRRWRARAQR